jgi:hypothetical protein
VTIDLATDFHVVHVAQVYGRTRAVCGDLSIPNYLDQLSRPNIPHEEGIACGGKQGGVNETKGSSHRGGPQYRPWPEMSSRCQAVNCFRPRRDTLLLFIGDRKSRRVLSRLEIVGKSPDLFFVRGTSAVENKISRTILAVGVRMNIVLTVDIEPFVTERTQFPYLRQRPQNVIIVEVDNKKTTPRSCNDQESSLFVNFDTMHSVPSGSV